MSLTEADTPLCNALESNALDSFDLRAWKSLARRLERDLAQIRAQATNSTYADKSGCYAAPPVPQFHDLELAAWHRIKGAIADAKWIPEDYCVNDWVNDLVRFAETGPQSVPQGVDKETLLQAIARGWCKEGNAHKDMDVDLAIAIAEEVIAAFPPPTVPQGMVLVPIEPTEEMLESALEAFRGFPVGRPSLVGCYKTMLKAGKP